MRAAQLKAISQRFHVWAAMTKRPPTKFDEMFADLPLFFVWCDGATRGIGLLLIGSDGQPRHEFFFSMPFEKPEAGDILHFHDLDLVRRGHA